MNTSQVDKALTQGTPPQVELAMKWLAAQTKPLSTLVSDVASLEAALVRTAPKLTGAALANAVVATYRRVTNNTRATRLALEELSHRGDAAAELVVVQALIEALKHYDSGHRPSEGTVFDDLVDVWLPRFGAEAQLALLSTLDEDNLSLEGDGFSALLGPAMNKATPAVRARLLSVALGEQLHPEPAATTPTKKRAAMIQAQLLAGELEVDELAPLDAEIRGAGFSRKVLLAYLVKPLIGTYTHEPATLGLLWRLASEDFAGTRAAIEACEDFSTGDSSFLRSLGEVLRLASRRDDLSAEFEGSPLLPRFAAWADQAQGKKPSASEDLAERISHILTQGRSREALARSLASQATGMLALKSEPLFQLGKLVVKLEAHGLYDAVVDWYRLFPRLAKARQFESELPAVIAASGKTGQLAIVKKLAPSVTPLVHAIALFHAYAQQKKSKEALAGYATCVSLGAEAAWKAGAPQPAWVQFGLEHLPALQPAVDATTKLVREAAFQGVDLEYSDEALIEVVTRAPTEKKIKALLKKGALGEALTAVVSDSTNGPLSQALVIEALLATRKVTPVDEEDDLAQLLGRMVAAGNHGGVLSWMKALPRLKLSDEGRQLVLEQGFAAARLAGSGAEQDLLPLVPKAPTAGLLCLELARLSARAGRQKETLGFIDGALASGHEDARAAIEAAASDPALKSMHAPIEVRLQQYKVKAAAAEKKKRAALKAEMEAFHRRS